MFQNEELARTANRFFDENEELREIIERLKAENEKLRQLCKHQHAQKLELQQRYANSRAENLRLREKKFSLEQLVELLVKKQIGTEKDFKAFIREQSAIYRRAANR